MSFSHLYLYSLFYLGSVSQNERADVSVKAKINIYPYFSTFFRKLSEVVMNINYYCVSLYYSLDKVYYLCKKISIHRKLKKRFK